MISLHQTIVWPQGWGKSSVLGVPSTRSTFLLTQLDRPGELWPKSVLTNCLRSIWRRRKNKNCWRPIEEMLEARLWVAGGTTSLIGDISFLWNIPTGDKWKVYSKYQFTHNVMKHASIYIDACWRPFLWNKLDWRSLTGFRRYAAATTAPRWCCQKNNLFTKKWTKWALNVKVCFFAFSHFNNFFGTHGHIPAIFNFLDLKLSALSRSQSPQHSKIYLQSLETKPETHFILWQSRGNLFHFS